MAGLYIHVPFRTAPRLYDETTVETDTVSPAAFAQAIIIELQHHAGEYADVEPITTVYFGGGRPSLLPPEVVDQLLDAIRTHFEADVLEEVTLELNPADATSDFLHLVRTLGVDRLSIELLSFYPADLKVLDAPHTAAQVEQVIDRARDAGFDNISVDLIFGWADQPEMHWKANVQKVARMAVPHVALMECPPDALPPASEAMRADHYRFAMEYLTDRGYEHYEISNFARPSRRGIHNQRHWDHSNYLGLGPGAHSFWWTDLPAHRWSNVQNGARYQALLNQRHLPLAQRTALDLPALAEEYVMLRLRTADGLDLDHLHTRYEVDLWDQKDAPLAWLLEDGYIELIADNRIRLTDRGKLVCDAVTAKLLPE